MTVVPHQDLLAPYLNKASQISKDKPVVISTFILGAREIEFDGVAQKGDLCSFGLSEHLEDAGVHSGDATMILPPIQINTDIKERIIEIAKQIAMALSIHGPYNIQFLVKDNQVKVIECNLRSSRSFPFVSKVLGHNLIDEAIRVMLNQPITPHPVYEPNGYVGIKAPQFSFARLRGADPCLGVEMSSTGEVGCLGKTLPEALLKSMHSVGYPLSISSVLISSGPIAVKRLLLDAARTLHETGVSIYATKGSAAFFRTHNIPCTLVYWPSDDQEPSTQSIIEHRKVDLVINIPKNFREQEMDNGYRIRRASVDFNIPLLTNAQIAYHYVHAVCTTTFDALEIKALHEYTVTK
jgi:carbamoyl-phosphate synthase large subunit